MKDDHGQSCRQDRMAEKETETDREMKRQTDKDEETETDGQTKETPQIINL